MSASEKLAALDEAMTPGPWKQMEHSREAVRTRNLNGSIFTGAFADAEGIATLRNALPALWEVVEAATEMANWLEMQSSNRYGRDLIPIRDFDAALARLNEALEKRP